MNEWDRIKKVVREGARQGHVVPDVAPEPARPVPPDHEPELERAKPPAQLNPPVAIVLYLGSLTGLQVFRKNLKGTNQSSGVFDEVCRTIEIREHPFMRIKDERVYPINSFGNPTHFREN